MKRLVFVFMLFPAIALAQHIENPFHFGHDIHFSVSPYSIQLWGKTPAAMKITAGYGDIEIVFIHSWIDRYIASGKQIKKKYDKKEIHYSGNWIGLFYTLIDFQFNRFQTQGGVGYFFHPFPVDIGANINFTLKLSYRITDHIAVQYAHISNGFGLFNNINPGIDNISLRVKF